MAQAPPDHLFISYSRRDDEVMRRIVTFLRNQGIKVWVDNERLVPGTPIWEAEIEKAIQAASAVVVIMSPDSKDSEWVRREIALADQFRKRIFPVLAAGDENSSITLRLVTRQFIDIRDNENAGFGSLSTSILFHFEELEAQQRAEREEAERLARAESERQAAEREAERMRLEREAAEKAKQEAVEQAAREKAERQNAERIALEAQEKATRERSEREAAEAAARLAAENAQREKSIREQAEREISELKQKRDLDRRRNLTRVIKRFFLYGVPAVLILIALGWWIIFYAPRDLPASLDVISAANADKVTQLTHWNNLQFSRVNAIAFSPDGRILAASSSDQKIRMRETNNGTILLTIADVNRAADTIVFSPDGQFLAANAEAGSASTVNLWSASDGKLQYSIKHPSEAIFPYVESIAFSPDGTILAYGSGNGPIRFYRTSDGSLVRTLEGHSGPVKSIAFSPDGQTLASGSWDDSVRIWRVSNGELLQSLAGDFSYANAVAFSPDGETLASGHWDNYNPELHLWRVTDGTLLTTYMTRHPCDTVAIAFSPDGTVLATASVFCDVRLWRVSDGTLLKTLEEDKEPVRSIAFSPDGKILAYGSDNGIISIWGIKP